MTVSSTQNRVSYAGNGATTAFSTSPVVFFDSGDLDVYTVVDSTGVATLKTITTHYTVTGGAGTTGTVTMLTAPAAGTTLLIVRTMDLTQAVDFVQNDPSDAEVAEDALDKITMILQQLDTKVDRAFALDDGDISGASTTLPTPEASTLIGWDSAGTTLQNYSAGEISAAILVTPYAETLLDDANAAAARTTLGLGTMAVEAAADYVVKATLDAAGDMYYASAADTPAKLANGAEMWMPTCGRLTLTTAVPMPSSDVTGATTVYFTPYKGNVVQLYDGTTWLPYIFAELSQLTTDATKSPAAVAVSSNYDVFVWNDSGTLRATRGPAWSGDKERGNGAGTTELGMLEGRYVNNVAITNGPAAQRGLYVGTIRSNASSQIEDSDSNRMVWNFYNRIPRNMFRVFTADRATTSATFVELDSEIRCNFVLGLSEDAVSIASSGYESGPNATVTGRTAAGINDATAEDIAATMFSIINVRTTLEYSFAGAAYGLSAGSHYITLLGHSDGSNSWSWEGNATAGTRCALHVVIQG